MALGRPRFSTEMLTTAGVIFSSSGASVGTPSRNGSGGVAAGAALVARAHPAETARAAARRRIGAARRRPGNGIPAATAGVAVHRHGDGFTCPFKEPSRMNVARTCGHERLFQHLISSIGNSETRPATVIRNYGGGMKPARVEIRSGIPIDADSIGLSGECSEAEGPLPRMIEIRNLTKRFGSLTAVDDVSFDVGRGEVLGFLGPNGAGKSTTMKMVTGFLAPDGGTIRIGGLDVATNPVDVKRWIGYLPEGAPLYGEMTTRAFLRFIAEIRGLRGADARRRIDSVIEQVSLASVLDMPIDTLSKGFKRRVGLAQAIVHDPRS